ncbi:SDR family NAD(P)-dependent oxidoreductase [Sinorhizobium fredii]|uniref:3-oxoacyl-(Acyl-carrier-protein) reductase protein n=1 Tax=Rhizobium fredii TaxID=380 RepID=A0A2L0HA51_RHIFR|nr:SDR family NAD(P)-dependent oxidoreductase [Sinorhizobium fredii]AUX78381.1 3-oxoacyl-(acyl-carrier-protein) reductase protein [Sinorhizobium fredii]
MSTTVGESRPVALITGGGTGIGAAIALSLASTHSIAICGRREETLRSVAEQTEGLALTADVSVPEDAAAVVEKVVAHFGRLDSLVLNAGTVIAAPVSEMSLADWQTQIDVNLTASFVIAKAAIPHLLKTKGSIVTISSVAGATAGVGLAAYSASKAGATLLTQTIALEYARHGLRANVIAPGWVRTEMADMEMAMLTKGGNPEEGYTRVTRLVPQRRAAEASEIANVAAFLLSPEASYVNGALINVDGGSSVVNQGLVEFDQN